MAGKRYPSYNTSNALPPISAEAGDTTFNTGTTLTQMSMVFVDGLIMSSDTYTISDTSVIFNVGLLEGQKIIIVP